MRSPLSARIMGLWRGVWNQWRIVQSSTNLSGINPCTFFEELFRVQQICQVSSYQPTCTFFEELSRVQQICQVSTHALVLSLKNCPEFNKFVRYQPMHIALGLSLWTVQDAICQENGLSPLIQATWEARTEGWHGVEWLLYHQADRILLGEGHQRRLVSYDEKKQSCMHINRSRSSSLSQRSSTQPDPVLNTVIVLNVINTQ